MTSTGSFWSRRLAAVEAERQVEAAEAEAAKLPVEAEKTDAEILDELGLPDPDDLMQGDDFAAFLSKAVPEHLRKRALRKLWRSNPVLACVDGLNDYDDDYLTGSYGNSPIKTTYQVGKGLLAHLRAVEEQIEPLVAPDKDDDVEVEEDIQVVEALPPVEDDETPEEELIAFAPRRMQFAFDGDTA